VVEVVVVTLVLVVVLVDIEVLCQKVLVDHHHLQSQN
jgi:hypothetical protein